MSASCRILLVPAGGTGKYRDDLTGSDTERRLIEGLQAWQEGGYDYLVLSGGTCAPPSRLTRPLACLMYEWLMQQPGHPDFSQVIVEDVSRDTFENVKYSLNALLKQAQLRPDAIQDVTVVTRPQHGKRFRITFGRCYKLPCRTRPTHPQVLLTARLMEFAYLLVHLTDPAGNGFIPRWNRRRRSF